MTPRDRLQLEAEFVALLRERWRRGAREYGDEETLSVTERELRQYAEQRSEFEERLREFWKDAEGERTAEDDERRFRLWRRERGE